MKNAFLLDADLMNKSINLGFKEYLLVLFILLLPIFRQQIIYSYWFWGMVVLVAYFPAALRGNVFVKQPFSERFDFLIFYFFAVISSVVNECLDRYGIYLLYYAISYGLYLVFKIALSRQRPNPLIVSYALGAVWGGELLLGVMQSIGNKDFYLSSEENLGDNTNIASLGGAAMDGIRVWGSFGDSLVFSNFIVAISVYLFSLLIAKRVPYLALFAFATLSFYLVALTGSRTGLVAYLILVIYSSASRLNIKYFLAFLLLAFVAVFFVPSEFFSKLTVLERLIEGDVTKDGRVDFYTNFFPMLFEQPWLGTGVWNLNSLLYKYGIMPWFSSLSAVGHVESVYMTIVLSVGVVGGGFFIHFLLRPVAVNFKLLRRGSECPALLAYISMLLSALSEPSLLMNMSVFTLFLLFRSMVVVGCDANRSRRSSRNAV